MKSTTAQKNKTISLPAIRLGSRTLTKQTASSDVAMGAALSNSKAVSAGIHSSMRKKDKNKAASYKAVRQHHETRKHFWRNQDT